MNLKIYLSLIESFVEKGYQFKFFTDEIQQKKNLLLRHDVDFDVLLSLNLAEYENLNHIRSTYFFMLRSDSYNILNPQNIDAVKKIYQFGHEISLHFDPLIYQDYSSGLTLELDLFYKLFGVNPKVISLHRPNKDFLQGIDIGVSHTYEKKFFKDIKYISDSGGEFKYGHPLDSDAYQSNQSIQLLLHPIWWMTGDDTNLLKLMTYYKYRCDKLSEHFSQNCLPWKEYIEGLK
jgi:hypothetical protein